MTGNVELAPQNLFNDNVDDACYDGDNDNYQLIGVIWVDLIVL